MERKIPPKSISTLSAPVKDSTKTSNLWNEKLSAKSKILHTSGKQYSPAEGKELLKQATEKISKLVSTTLPPVPHILTVPKPLGLDLSRYSLDDTSHPLFSREEYRRLQYITLISCNDRDTIILEPGWAKEEKSISPTSTGGEKSIRTPNGEVDGKRPEFKKKIKFGDYAKVGKIPTTQAVDTMPVMQHRLPPKPPVVKSISSPMITTKHGAVPESKSDGVGVSTIRGDGAAQSTTHFKATSSTERHSKTNGDSTVPEALKKPAQSSSKPPVNSNSHTPAINAEPKAIPNGIDRAAKNQAESSSQKGHLKRPLEGNEEHSVKKAKVSASVSVGNDSTAKRPLADDDSSSTKKAKLANGVPSKDLDISAVLPAVSKTIHEIGKKESPLKSRPPAISESNGKKPVPSKPSTLDLSKGTPPSASKPSTAKLPPLLSPTLPPQVIAANGLSSALKSTNTANGLSPAGKANVGNSSANSTAPQSLKPKADSGVSKPEAGTLKSKSKIPPLLSPDLPPLVEAALAARNASHGAVKDSPAERHIDAPKKISDSVCDRHEKSRQPDAPGIARKVVKTSRNGPETASESIHAVDFAATRIEDTVTEEKPSLTVKLKYKKRQKKDIERILKLRADPAAGHDQNSSESSHKHVGEESSKSKAADRPTARDERRNSLDRARLNERNVATKRPASTTAQKRPHPEESQPAANKRLKPSDHPQSSKPTTPSTPAMKPSVTSAPSSAQKAASGTPKKSEALKSIAMIKVNSTDGSARTPQSGQVSVPGSVEKPSGTLRGGGHETREKPGVLAVKLKREMDRLHQLKTGGVNNVSVADRKHGLVVGFECSLAYMASFDSQDAVLASSRQPNNGKAWDDLLKLHNYIDAIVRDIPILDVLTLQIKILSRFRMSNAFASSGYKDVNLGILTHNTVQQEKLWHELDMKMSDELAQSIEESTSGNRKGFNPGGNFKQFIETSLRKLTRYADTEGIQWDQKLFLG